MSYSRFKCFGLYVLYRVQQQVALPALIIVFYIVYKRYVFRIDFIVVYIIAVADNKTVYFYAQALKLGMKTQICFPRCFVVHQELINNLIYLFSVRYHIPTAVMKTATFRNCLC